MNRASALDRLSVLSAAEHDPQLSFLELETLLGMFAKSVDADGNPPDAEEWTPTYSVIGIHRAVKAAFEVKAAKASDRFDFTTDGQMFNRSQVSKILMMMADSKKSSLSSTARTGGS